MQNKPEPACLLIADISGYTDYLAGVELDHAQDILADLVDTVVRALRPPFRLAKLEGDAAFAWVVAETVDGSQIQDVVERTYATFRRRLRDIGRASRCECNACIRIPRLDLKFVVHHGTVVRQRMAGGEELVGRDVILVHRLLKNSVTEQTGIGAYALYTADCVAAMGAADPAAQGLVAHRETIDVIGEVDGWVRDLEAAWQAALERAATEIRPDEAYWVHRYRTPAPPAVTWDWVTSPIHRPKWGGMQALNERAPAGRRGAGTVNHCVHGRDTIVEEVLDWRPYDYLTTRSTLPTPGTPKVVMTEAFRGLPDGGTEVELRVARPRPRDRQAFSELFASLEPMILSSGSELTSLLEEVVAESAATSGPDEPPLPRSAGRFASEPVGAAAGTVDSRAGGSSHR